MNINKLTATVCAATGFVAGAVFVSPVLAQHEGHQGGGHAHSYKGGSLALHEMMEKSAQKMGNMKMSGDTDKDFAMAMAEHHADGIKMADIELKYGKAAALKAMARKIKAAQTKERQQLLMHARMKH